MTSDDQRLERARVHMSAVAAGLAATLGHEAAIATLLGAATTLLTERGTDADAASHLRLLADEVEAGKDAPTIGHA